MRLSKYIYSDTLDDLVDSWHEGEEAKLPLHEYLEISWEDYCVWAINPNKHEKYLRVSYEVI